MNIFFILAGIYLIVDALASLAKFSGQPLPYQLVRVGRFVIGLGLLVYHAL